MTYRTLTDITIPAGTEFIDAPAQVRRRVPFGEAFLGFSPDGISSMVIDEETLKLRTDLFSPATA